MAQDRRERRVRDFVAVAAKTLRDEPALRHLPKSFMYSAPLPKTKLESPRPHVSVSG